MEMMGDKLPVRGVTLDLWETLLFEREGYDAKRSQIRCRNLRRVLGEYGVSIPNECLLHALEAMGPWLGNIWDRNDEVTHRDQIGFIVKIASGGSVEVEEEWIDRLSVAYASAIFELPPYLNPDALTLLRWLKGRGKKIWLISNVGRTPGFALRNFLEAEGVAEYFDVMVFSDEVRVRKPSREIFLLVARKLGVEPSNIVHIGDDLRSDVWGAKNAGLRAVHLSSSVGSDRLAESDPTSLTSIGRGKPHEQEGVVPDGTITSLSMAVNVLQQLER